MEPNEKNLIRNVEHYLIQGLTNLSIQPLQPLISSKKKVRKKPKLISLGLTLDLNIHDLT